jgi:ABC-type sugar transport system ATPase subunit
MTTITLNNLTKRIDNKVVVNNISLKINDKEFMVFLGPPGCGKTTTLRMIAGLETPTSGEIYFDDQLINDMTPTERNVAMVFQSFALYPHLTVFDNIASPLKKRGESKEEITKKVKEVASLLKIDKLLDKIPAQLSGGEKQRVALARAIVRTPRVYLFDEPLTNLDAKLRVLMRGELKRLQRELGQTVIYVTPDPIEAMAMADRIAIMHEGRVLQYDAPSILYSEPKDLFVARYLSVPAINLLDCSFVTKDDEAYLDFGVFKLDFTKFRKIIEEKGCAELIFGIRPINVTIHEKSKLEEGIEAEVCAVEYEGDRYIINLFIQDKIIIATSLNEYNIGQKVWITFDMKNSYIFDKSGTRVFP